MSAVQTKLLKLIEKNFGKNIKIADVCSGYDAWLTKRLKDSGFTDVTSFEISRKTEFFVDNGKDFDLLVAELPCNGTEVLIESAIKYKKELIFIPCHCDEKYKSHSSKVRRLKNSLRKTHRIINLGFRSKYYCDYYSVVWAIPKGELK